MKKMLIFILLTIVGFAWETTTHRAIDRIAIQNSFENGNLKIFLQNSNIATQKYDKEIYEGYSLEGQSVTYCDYIEDRNNKNKDAVSDWNQTFSPKRNYQDLIEAGTMLEDAVWPGALFSANGRFNNHFYDPQNGGKGLTWGYGRRTDAISWAKNGWRNSYSFEMAQRWFANGFTLPQESERRKYQAKMLVSVGHLMHMMNDMNVPAHTRDDSHPLGDPLEVWMRGGWDGSDASQGFHVMGSKVAVVFSVQYSAFREGV